MGLAASVAIAMLLVGLISPECPPTLFGDYGLYLRGVVSSPGWVGVDVDDELFSVNVEAGDTAEQIGPQLAAAMRAEGLRVDCERFVDCQGGYGSYESYGGECYCFIIRDAHGPPELESQARGLGRGGCGPVTDDRHWIQSQVKGFYAILNANRET